MRHFRCFPTIVAFAWVGSALAQGQGQPKQSSIENRANIGVNTAGSSSEPKEKLNTVDSEFLRAALDSGRRENDKARLALSHGSDPAVKDFAQRLMDDHAAESKELTSIAAKSGFSAFLSVTGDYFSARSEVDARTGEKRNPAKDDVSHLRGAAFDREFAKQIAADTQSRISKFEAAQRDATNPGLREFAASTLPKLREHLAQAQALGK
jgi:putative membrane protein